MKVYNTLSRKKEEFIPLEEGKVKMYVCGPTVYNYIHIGNARPFVIFDTLRRFFEYLDYDVRYVQNYTDIDDKIINKANEEGTSHQKIAEKYIKEVEIDARGLNTLEPTVTPRVTEEIDEIIEMIKVLIEKGYAYEKNGSVYFNTLKDDEYGKLSRRDLEEMLAGARIQIDDEKENPFDFILWKPKKEGEPYWDSPWSKGRPGWHIECSVMAKKYLGDSIDIHAGGEDLIFPHHENEIAQSEAANEKEFAKYWMHNGFIQVDNQKMSKSLGNFFTLREISEEYSYDVIRYFLLSTHYRSPMNFSRELMDSAKTSLDRIKQAVNNMEYIEETSKLEKITADESKLLEESKKYRILFEENMKDDLNTAGAISNIFELVRFANVNTDENTSVEFAKALREEIIFLSEILGLIVVEEKEVENEEEIEKLVEERNQARKDKDFQKSDEIRDKLLEMGIIIEDTRQGVRWYKK